MYDEAYIVTRVSHVPSIATAVSWSDLTDGQEDRTVFLERSDAESLLRATINSDHHDFKNKRFRICKVKIQYED